MDFQLVAIAGYGFPIGSERDSASVKQGPFRFRGVDDKLVIAAVVGVLANLEVAFGFHSHEGKVEGRKVFTWVYFNKKSTLSRS